MSLVEDAVRHRLLFLAGGSLAVLLMVLLVSVLIARSLTRPLHRLGDVATRIGEGELGAQAEESGQREVAEVAAALNSMSRRIEQAMRAQRDFVANASHQLRTPLTGLRLRLEGLVAGGVEGASPALAETDRLARLIDDLLTLVRVGSEPEAPESADLRQAAIDAVDRWSIQASDTGHVLVLEGEDRPHWGTVSAADIAIVADNLIENALKYTPAGTTVTIGVAADEHDGVVLGVRDDGPGMTDEDRERAFERFYRGTRGRAETGTGLGLAIVRQMIERWGGSVDIFDADGTCFEVWVRAAAKSGAAADDTDRIPSLF